MLPVFGSLVAGGRWLWGCEHIYVDSKFLFGRGNVIPWLISPGFKDR